ncbi:hypothetical protein VKS41_005016 [Umbelopsis sp. WA50703]
MSKSVKALGLKQKQDWETSVYCFSRNNRNNLTWEKDQAARTTLKHYFQKHLTSTPHFKHSTARVTVQMYYYADPNLVTLSEFEIKPLEQMLQKIYPHKFVDVRFVRLHYPYLNAEILAKYLTINAQRSSWSVLTRKFMKGVPIVKPPLPHHMPPAVQWNNLVPHAANGQLTSAIQGVKYQVSGRLGRRRGAGRGSVLRKSLGTFKFTTAKSLIDVGRHSFANRNGSITVKVWISSALFGAGALLNKAGQKAAAASTKKL